MIRQILLVISGCIITHLAFRFEHYDTFLDVFLLILLIPIASILFILTLIKEIAAFRKTKRFQDLAYTLQLKHFRYSKI